MLYPPPDGKSYQQLVTDGEGNTGWADRLAWDGTHEFAFSGTSESDFSFNMYNSGDGGYKTLYMVYPGNYSYDDVKNMVLSVGTPFHVSEGSMAATITTNSPNYGTITLVVYYNDTELTDYDKNTITVPAGVYIESGYGLDADTDFTATFGTIQFLDPKFLPEATAVADAAGETPTATEFNALLASLRTAGYLSE